MSESSRLTPEQIDNIMKSNPMLLYPLLFRNNIHKVEAEVRMRNWYDRIGFAGLHYEDRIIISVKVQEEAHRQFISSVTPYELLKYRPPKIVEWFKRKVLRK